MPTTTTSARFAIVTAALLFSTGGAAIKGTTLSALQVAGLRSGIAALVVLAFFPAARRIFDRRLLPAAAAYAGTLVLFVVATKLTTAAAAIFLQSTAPVWVLALSPILLREPMRRRDLPYAALACAGLLLVFVGSRGPAAIAPHPALGNACGLVAGLCYALLVIGLRHLARDSGVDDRSIPATALGNLIAFAACALFSFPLSPTARDIVAVGYLGIVQVGLAYFFLARGLRTLPAVEVSLLLLLEPVLNPFWTWLMHDEQPSPLAAAGGLLLVVSLAARALLERPLVSPTGS